MERGVEIGDQHVVGLDRLESARDEAFPVCLERDRRRREADRAIRGRGLSL